MTYVSLPPPHPLGQHRKPFEVDLASRGMVGTGAKTIPSPKRQTKAETTTEGAERPDPYFHSRHRSEDCHLGFAEGRNIVPWTENATAPSARQSRFAQRSAAKVGITQGDENMRAIGYLPQFHVTDANCLVDLTLVRPDRAVWLAGSLAAEKRIVDAAPLRRPGASSSY